MDFDAEAATRRYLAVRTARSNMKKDYENRDDILKGELERVETEMLGFLNATGQKTASTDSGTFYKQEDILPTGADWDAFYNWVGTHNAFDALERRIKKTFITEYMQRHDGELPPGVNVLREWVVRVRKGKGDSNE